MQESKPVVKRRLIVRQGRGYSLGELKAAGIDPRIQRRNGVPVDRLRRSEHQENVDQLKSIVKTTEPRKSHKKKKE